MWASEGDYSFVAARDSYCSLSLKVSQAFLAQEGPGSVLIEEGMPTLMGLVMIEKTHGVKAADDYAAILQDRLRRRMAREGGTQATILSSNFEDYAGMQAALALFEQRKKGRDAFDRLLAQTWRDSEQEPFSPAKFAVRMELPSAAGVASSR